jgi:hypothetical protein
MRLVELAADPAADVARALDLRQAPVEHELGKALRSCHLRFQDAGLAREQHALGAQIGDDLICAAVMKQASVSRRGRAT